MNKERELLKLVQKVLNQKFDYYLDIEKDIEDYLASNDDEPVAYVGDVFELFWHGKGHYSGIKVGDYLYRNPQRNLSDEDIKKIVLNEFDPRDFNKMDFLEYSVLVARAVLEHS